MTDPTRCSCKGTLPTECNCTISGSSTVDVSGGGSSGSPYVASPNLAADPGLLSCEDDGLLGKWPDRVLSLPRAKVWDENSIVVNFPGPVVFAWDTVYYDTHGFFNPATPTRLTNVLGQTALFGIGTGVSLRLGTWPDISWALQIRLNGGPGETSSVTRPLVDGYYNSQIAPASLVPLEDNLMTYSEYPLDPGDYVEVLISASSSIDRDRISKPRMAPVFWITYLSD